MMPWIVMGFSVLTFLIIFAMHCRIRKSEGSAASQGTALTETEAVEIYTRKLNLMQSVRTESRQNRNIRIKNEYARIAIQYRVSPKTVMDIWNHKTWIMATSHLWESE